MSDLEAALSSYLASAARNNKSGEEEAWTALPNLPNLNATAPPSSSSSSAGPPAESIIFDYGELAVLVTFYGITFVLGLLSNIAMLYVILGRPKNRTPRNMFIANLCLSGLAMTLFCIPPTFMQILYGGWWHLGLVACKLVPAIQGANILVGAFTVTVIAIDRWMSVANTNPNSAPLNYTRAFAVSAAVWLLAFLVTSPLLFYQTVNRMVYPGTDLVLAQICTETFPTQLHKHGFTFVILAVQYVMPLVVLPIVHANILLFLRKNSGFQTDQRRRERELKRNRRMTFILTLIGFVFAVSWLPFHLFVILTDVFFLFQANQRGFYLGLGLCHAVAMTSAFTNPILYGWFNTQLKSELETLVPKRLRRFFSNIRCCRRNTNASENGNSAAVGNGNAATGNGNATEHVSTRISSAVTTFFRSKRGREAAFTEVDDTTFDQRLTLTTPSRALEPRRDIITTAASNTAAATEGRNGGGPETTKNKAAAPSKHSMSCNNASSSSSSSSGTGVMTAHL